ncbi:MAG: hypothetical protein ACTHXB_03755 [Luteimonas sp.]
MRHVHRRYAREFLPAMVAYVVVLMLSTWALHHVEAAPLRVLLALAPAVPVAMAARAVLRFVRDSDELQRRIMLEAAALAALVLTMACFSLGLLALAGTLQLHVGLALTMVLPAYCGLHGLFACLAQRHYR